MANGLILSQSFRHLSPALSFPNQPVGWSNVSEIDFSQTPVQSPPSNDQVDNSIPGSADWKMIFFAQNWVKASDGLAVSSPVWRGTIKAGSWYEQHTVPGSPFTVACNFPSNFGTDQNIFNLTTDSFMTRVGSSPASGQYSVDSGGTYTFNSVNAGNTVLIAYLFANSAGLSGSTATGTPFGHGIGNIFTYTPSGATRLYWSGHLRFGFPDATYWHSISNKFVNIETNAGLILVQLREGSNWRHAEDLGSGFFIDPSNSPGQVDNRAVPVNQNVQIEVMIDLTNHIFKVWQDGVITTNTAAANFAGSSIVGFSINTFRGGGGETLAADLTYQYDHFRLAW